MRAATVAYKGLLQLLPHEILGSHYLLLVSYRANMQWVKRGGWHTQWETYSANNAFTSQLHELNKCQL